MIGTLLWHQHLVVKGLYLILKVKMEKFEFLQRISIFNKMNLYANTAVTNTYHPMP